jgi:GcrA cell cycle regulator
MPGKTWTDDEDRQLVALEDRGLSAYFIGEKMGKTRSAIIGRSYRLRGGTRKSPVQRPRKPVTISKPPVPPRPRPVNPDTGARMITIFELTGDTCRWPHGDRSPFLFCGAPALASQPYCEKHCTLSLSLRQR